MNYDLPLKSWVEEAISLTKASLLSLAEVDLSADGRGGSSGGDGADDGVGFVDDGGALGLVLRWDEGAGNLEIVLEFSGGGVGQLSGLLQERNDFLASCVLLWS